MPLLPSFPLARPEKCGIGAHGCACARWEALGELHPPSPCGIWDSLHAGGWFRMEDALLDLCLHQIVL